MGLFNFWKKKKSEAIVEPLNKEDESKLLLAMPIFINGQSYTLDSVIDHLRSFWNVSVAEVTGDDNTAVFEIDGIAVALGAMPVPIPEEELESVISYVYMWRTATEELKHQTGHAIVSVMGENGTSVERHMVLSKLLCSVMMTTDDCIAVYQGSETLLLQKEYYLSSVDDIKNNRIPVPAWIYIGLRKSGEHFDAYTYGMNGFGKPEIEIIGSALDWDQLYKLILSISSYAIGSDVLFKDGDIYNLSESVGLKLTLSKGVYIDGTSLKVEA
ncbi:DUF4261 domain-containing protein [Dysgonomonas sp. OttesenSCG-928-M03]|nr:DUF4261 domain-containing protein [Dysgonomonas sp. OttesenSCG-928-M03]